MAEVPFCPVRQLSEYKGKGASASREGENSNGTVHSGGMFRKKGNTFRGIHFPRFFSGIPGNFCTICPQLPVPDYFREDSNAHDGGFK